VKITKKLFGELATRFAGRNGGYTRIIRIGGSRRGEGPSELKYRMNNERRKLRLTGNRLGDNAQQVILEFVGSEVSVRAEQTPEEKKE
jgi:large subunit ribosomal protein L17